MPKKKPSEKNKAWEKDRRDRLNKSFVQLAKLLPQYDPSVTWSKVEIIQKSIEHIENLHKKNEEFLKSTGPETLTEYNELVAAVKYFQSRNGQLADLLGKAKISLPACKPLPSGVIEKFKENNYFNKIHIKPVGRPGKFVNKNCNENDDYKLEYEKTKFSGIKTENTDKDCASSIGAEQISSETSAKQAENTTSPLSTASAVPLNSNVNVEMSVLMETGILLPVIPLQPKPPLNNQSVISPKSVPPPVISTISSLTPIINIKSITSSSQKIVNNTTSTQVFKYAKDKNGKIKILPRPQVKLYFRRADGKIPIAVIKKRAKPVKKKRKRKYKPPPPTTTSTTTSTTYLNSKKRKMEKCNKEDKSKKENRDSNEAKAIENTEGIRENENIVEPTLDNIADEKVKNSKSISNILNEAPPVVVVQSDYLSELEIPQSETNPNSVSPTAAFLMSFPVVSTSNGKFSGIVEDSEILTQNLERKDSGVDSLENLNNFFTTKEYTKYCRENSEKNGNSEKNKKAITILEDIKIASYNSSSTFFNPFSVTSTGVGNTTSTTPLTKPIAYSFNDIISEQPHQLLSAASKQQMLGNLLYMNSVNSNSQIDVPKTETKYPYSNNRINIASHLVQNTEESTKPLLFHNELHALTNPSQPAKAMVVSTASTRRPVAVSKTNNFPVNNCTSFHVASTTTAMTKPTVPVFHTAADVAVVTLGPPTLPFASLTSTFTTTSVPIASTSIAPISMNPSSISTPLNTTLPASIVSAASKLNYQGLKNFSCTGEDFTNKGIFSNQVASSSSTIWPVSFPSSCFSSSTNSTALPIYTSTATTFPSLCFSKSSSRSATQNLFSTSTPTNTLLNSFTPHMVPRCTPLPLDSSVKQINTSRENQVDNRILGTLKKPPIPINTYQRHGNSCNNLPPSTGLIQKSTASVVPSCIFVPGSMAESSSMPKFSCPIPSSGDTFNMSLPLSITEPNCSSIKTSSASMCMPHVSLPSLTNYNMSHSRMSVINNKKDEISFTTPSTTILCSATAKSQTVSSLITSQTGKTSNSMTKSVKAPSTHVDSSTSQGLLSTNLTSTHSYVSAGNYYYPQAPSTFTLNLTTPSNVSSQIVSSQGVLPYSPLKPDISWMPPISKEYKPSFTFSLTPTSATACKQSSSNSSLMSSSSISTSTFSNFPSMPKESKITSKPVFNPFDSSTRYKTPPHMSNIKDPGNTFASSTSFTFSLTNPKSSIVTTAESKIPPFTSTSVPKVQQQFNNNFDSKFQPNTSHQQLFNINSQQPESNQNDLCFTFALTKTSKTVTTVQKSRNPFTIDATLGIANSNTCYLDGGNKSSTTTTTLCSSGLPNDTKIPVNRIKLPNKIEESTHIPVQANNNNQFYECNQKPEKFTQRAHVNWMTSSEVQPTSSDYGHHSSYRTAADSYHPYAICDENFPSWSPSKIYDTSHLIAPPATVVATVPNYYSDINFNTPSYNVTSGILDTSSKVDKIAYKPPISNGNQANFFSVSQLVDQGTNSKQFDGYQKKISSNKSKDTHHKSEDFKPPYLNNAPQTVFSENITYSGPPKAPLSNNYSAEALISKKEKHRNFGGIGATDFYNPMDVSGMYNQPDQSYNSNYFYNYPSNQNYGQDSDYLGAYTSDNQFGKVTNKQQKKLPPPTAPPPPPPNLISYDSNYFPVPLAVTSPLNPLPSIDGYDSHHYNHSTGNYQSNSWVTKTSTLPGGYPTQSQHFQPSTDLGQMNSDHVQNTVQPSASGNLANFNLSTICPEINDKVPTPNVW